MIRSTMKGRLFISQFGGAHKLQTKQLSQCDKQSAAAVDRSDDTNNTHLEPTRINRPSHGADVKVGSYIEDRLRQPSVTTLAELAPHSKDLQMLLALGVSFRAIEKHPEAIDVVTTRPYYPEMHAVVTLLTQLGVDDVAAVINKCPLVLGQEADALKARLLYLSGRQFTTEQIRLIVSKYPSWLLTPIEQVDAQLGAIQQLFHLSATNLRLVISKCPRMVSTKPLSLEKTRYALKQEFKFDQSQLTQILTTCPTVFQINQQCLERRLDCLLNDVSVSRDQIVSWPLVLKCRERIVRERHGVLSLLQRAIYDRTLPGYVSLQSLVSGSDEHFATNVAHITLDKYYAYLKTL